MIFLGGNRSRSSGVVVDNDPKELADEVFVVVADDYSYNDFYFLYLHLPSLTAYLHIGLHPATEDQ